MQLLGNPLGAKLNSLARLATPSPTSRIAPLPFTGASLSDPVPGLPSSPHGWWSLQGKLLRNGHHPPLYSGASERFQPDARTKDGEPKAQKSQTCCSLPYSVTRAQLLAKAQCAGAPARLPRASYTDRPAGADSWAPRPQSDAELGGR